MRSLAVSLVALVAGFAGMSNAQAAGLTIEDPSKGSWVNTARPAFEGTTTDVYNEELEIFDPVTVNIYQGTSVQGNLVQTSLPTPLFRGPVWSVTAAESLPDGSYTAEAVQGFQTSEPVTFTVDTAAPAVAISSPANGSSITGEVQLFVGTASTGRGDLPEVRIKLFAGAAIAGSPLEELIVKASAGVWSIPAALRPGTYTAQATQTDEAGNVGPSPPVTFTLTAPPTRPIPLPVASFSWFPSTPVIGQTVVLVSSSSDAASPITGFSWDLSGTGFFNVSGPVASTSFSTFGNHVVRLRVTDARGASSIASETIPVGRVPLKPMLPFPIVRIAGVQTPAGVKLSLVSVQAPLGTRVTVACRGRGCSMKPQSRIATTNAHNRRANSVVLTFRRFERSFRAGVTLEVRVSASGEIGKYTLFSIHRHLLPTRVDSCLSAFDPKPITCAR